MKNVRYMVFSGNDTSHINNSESPMITLLREAKEVYDAIDTSQYRSKVKHIKRLEFERDWEPATDVKIVEKNY